MTPSLRRLTGPLAVVAGVVVGGLGACLLLIVKMLELLEAAHG